MCFWCLFLLTSLAIYRSDIIGVCISLVFDRPVCTFVMATPLFFSYSWMCCWLQFYDPSSLVQTLSYVIHESLMYTFWSYLTQDDDQLIDHTRDTLTCASLWNLETHSTRIQSIVVPTYLYFIKCQLLKQSVIHFASKTFLQWSIIVYDEDLDEKSLSIWQCLQHCKSTMPKTCLQGMTNHVRLQVVLVTLHTGGL